ncbi:hypothetical protein JL722_1981 [Aureococcus anophagefferens]|nr:hypothetical protein JL722_1981 [Aureococcus anophagefferens]
MDAELRATLAAQGHVVHDEADCVKRVRRLGVEEVDESDDDDYLRPDVDGGGAATAAGVEIGVDDAPVDLSRPLESRADAASFFVNDVRTDRRAARSIETRETMPRTLWGTPLRRVIVSSFMDPVSNGQFFRDWFLHWDTDDRIPIVVLAHATKAPYTSVVANDGSRRPVGNYEADPEGRFVRDASAECFSVPRPSGDDARTVFFDAIEGKTDGDAIPWALANATVCLPPLPTPKEAHHYEGTARACVCASSANLCEGEQTSQLEVWFVHDFRFAAEQPLRSLVLDDDATRLAAAAGDGGRRPLTFGANLVDFLARMTEGLGDEVCVDGDTLGNWRSRLLACDTSTCDGVQLLRDVEGGEAAFDASPKRLTRSKKAECVQLKDATFEDGETFRDGSVVAPGFRGFFPKPLAAAIRSLRAAGTRVRVELACVFSGARLLPKAGERGSGRRRRKPARARRGASFSVAVDAWGPTTDASTSAFAVLLSSLRTPQGYQALRVALDGEGVDCAPPRRRSAHAKFIYRLFLDEASGETFGWVYVGSHNFSAAAWGAGPRWGYCRTTNWELGVVLQQPPGAGAAGVPPFHRRYPLPYVPGAPRTPTRC